MLLANRRVAARRLGQTEEERLGPQERPAAQDRALAARADVRDRSLRRLRINRRVDGLERIDRVDEVMRHAPALLRGRLARADVEAAVDLHAVGAHDLAADALGDTHRELGLARRRRSDDREERLRIRLGDGARAADALFVSGRRVARDRHKTSW